MDLFDNGYNHTRHVTEGTDLEKCVLNQYNSISVRIVESRVTNWVWHSCSWARSVRWFWSSAIDAPAPQFALLLVHVCSDGGVSSPDLTMTCSIRSHAPTWSIRYEQGLTWAGWYAVDATSKEPGIDLLQIQSGMGTFPLLMFQIEKVLMTLVTLIQRRA
jgi:hypothetical protein